MWKWMLSILFLIVLLIYPLSLSAQNNFSLSLDVDGSAGDQAVTSLNVSANEVIAIQIFGRDIQNTNGITTRFEYDASQVAYEGFDAGIVLPGAQVLSEQGTNPTFVGIGIASLGSQATVNSGLVGTIRFRTTAAFSGAEIRLVRGDLVRGGQIETVALNIRIALQVSNAPSSDFDGDGIVNLADFLLFVSRFGSRQGDGTYETKYDLDSNSAIELSDFLIFVNDFGKRVSSPVSPPMPPPIDSVTMPGVRLLRLTQNYYDVEYLAYSPDGSQIAFVSEREDNNDAIYVMNADGSNPIRLTQNYYDVEYLAYSPDGSQIAFVSEREDNNDAIYVMNADGSNPIRLTQNYYDIDYLFWSSNGSEIIIFLDRDDDDRNDD